VIVLRGFCLAVLLLVAAAPARAENPDTLWNLVHEKCVPGFLASGDPKPCEQVVLPDGGPNGWVLLKDRDGATQYLVIPATKVTGIEDPSILAPDAPNYFAAAWASRGEFLGKVGHPLPRADISLAINSPYGRTQNQLHIHIDCVRSDVAAALQGQLGAVGPAWAPLGVALEGHPYRAMRLDGADLTENPFLLLAKSTGAEGIRTHTLVAVAETFPDGKDGFVLLDDKVEVPLGDRASGEELQDHACAVAR
jgi:CDP-diacylglycerol pyrophosphatase